MFRLWSFSSLAAVALGGEPIVLEIQRRQPSPADVPLDGSIGMDGQLNVPICVGGNNFLVMIDTGSADLGLVSSECHRCAKRTSGHATYNPKHGSAAKPISFSKSDGIHCDTSYRGQCAVSQSFEDNTGWKSALYYDDFAFGNCANWTNVQTVVGAIYSASGEPSGESSVDGLLGLAYRTEAESHAPTPFDILVKQGVLQNLFAIALCSDHTTPGAAAGALEIGGDGNRFMRSPKEIQWTPIISETFYTIDLEKITVGDIEIKVDHKTLNAGDVIVDSGTTDIMVPSAVYKKIAEALFSLCSHDKPIKGLCYTSGGRDQRGSALPMESSILKRCTKLTTIEGYPDVVFQFSGGMKVPVLPRHYLRGQQSYCPDSDGHFQIGITDSGENGGTLLGDVFMVTRVSVFDRANKRIGFAKLDQGAEPCASASRSIVV